MQVAKMNLHYLYTPVIFVAIGSYIIARYYSQLCCIKLFIIHQFFSVVSSQFTQWLWILYSYVYWKIWREMMAVNQNHILWAKNWGHLLWNSLIHLDMDKFSLFLKPLLNEIVIDQSTYHTIFTFIFLYFTREEQVAK